MTTDRRPYNSANVWKGLMVVAVLETVILAAIVGMVALLWYAGVML